MLILMACRARPILLPKIRDLKKLFGGRSKNFWYGVEEDGYLNASALGSHVVTINKFHRGDWHSSRRFVGLTYLALVGTSAS